MYSDDNSSLWNIHYGKFCCKKSENKSKEKKENCYHEKKEMKEWADPDRRDAEIL